jgi:CubicO group peptidase (beta-lactamase class C family)/beta-glucosidase-like glycosyl hydrolase
MVNPNDKPIKVNRKLRKAVVGLYVLTGASILFFLVWYFFILQKEVLPQTVTDRDVPFLEKPSRWADSVLATMTPQQKAAQLFICDADANAYPKGDSQFLETIYKTGIGGLYFKRGSISSLPYTINHMQSGALVPILCAADAEYGLYGSSDSLSKLFRMNSLMDISDIKILKELASHIALQCRKNGLQMVFGPSLNIIDENIDKRYEPSYFMFINDLQKRLVSYTQELQKNGLISVARSFPAYNMVVEQDSMVPENLRKADSLRSMPLRKLIAAGLSGVMLNNGPAPSKTTIIDSLHAVYRFKGLVLSDLLNGKTATGAEMVDVILKSLQMGSDMVLIPFGDGTLLQKAIDAASRKLPASELDAKVKKILYAKAWAIPHPFSPVRVDSANFYALGGRAEMMARMLAESSQTLITNKDKFIPLKNIQDKKIAVLEIGSAGSAAFKNMAGNYSDVACFSITSTINEKSLETVVAKLKPYNTVLIAVYPVDKAIATHVVAEKLTAFLEKLKKQSKISVSVFGDKEMLAGLRGMPVLLWCGGSGKFFQEASAQAIFGGMPVMGRLPSSWSDRLCYNDGIYVPMATRLKYTIPEDAGLDRGDLSEIDNIVKSAIGNGAFPGCQVFCALKGKVIYNRAFGNHTYEKNENVRTTDLYDIASVTKVAATTIALMTLYDKGKIKLDTTLEYYFDDLDKNASGKKVRIAKIKSLSLRELLTHRSGLPSGMPIGRFISPAWALKQIRLAQKRAESEALQDTTEQAEESVYNFDIDTNQVNLDADSLYKYIYSKTKKPEYSLEIADKMFMRNTIVDSIWQLAKQVGVRKSKNYLYSDMNLYLVMKVVESSSKQQLDDYLDKVVYGPLNLRNTCFNPLQNYKKERIIPTEDEKIFRKQLIHGYVHDPLAALNAGIGGNAGLFSSAHDLGILMQMMLNGGTYGGIRFFNEKTVELFTSVQEGTYRGLGWDHQTSSGAKMIARSASPSTYGHTGFTGTCVWVDPEIGLVYVFLSNRVCPRSSNQKINGTAIRQRVQQVVYNAIAKRKSD